MSTVRNSNSSTSSFRPISSGATSGQTIKPTVSTCLLLISAWTRHNSQCHRDIPCTHQCSNHHPHPLLHPHHVVSTMWTPPWRSIEGSPTRYVFLPLYFPIFCALRTMHPLSLGEYFFSLFHFIFRFSIFVSFSFLLVLVLSFWARLQVDDRIESMCGTTLWKRSVSGLFVCSKIYCGFALWTILEHSLHIVVSI